MFNCGNIRGIRRLVTSHFAEDCAFQAMSMPAPKIGKHFVSKFFSDILVTHPDTIFYTKKNRVVIDSLGRCIKWTTYGSATNIAPTMVDINVFRKFNNIDSSHFDAAYLSKSEIEQLQQTLEDICTKRLPYSAVTRFLFRCGLNDEDKVISFTLQYRYLSIKPANLENFGVGKNYPEDLDEG